MRVFLVFIALFMLLGTGFAQERDVTVFRKYRNIDTVEEGSMISETYYFVNHTSGVLRVLDVNPECICTSYDVSSYVIPAQDSISVTVNVNTSGKYGENTLYTIVKTEGEVLMHKLALKFFVVPRK